MGIVVLSIVLGISLQDRPQAQQTTATRTKSRTAIAGDSVSLDAKDWATKLKGVADRAGVPCSKVIATFENGQRAGNHVWSMRCSNGDMYAVTFREGQAATLTSCDLATRNGVACFEKGGK